MVTAMVLSSRICIHSTLLDAVTFSSSYRLTKLLVLRISVAFHRSSCWFVLVKYHLMILSESLLDACYESWPRDGYGDPGSVSKASLEAICGSSTKTINPVSRGMFVNSSDRPASRFINRCDTCCSSSSFLQSALTGTVNSCLSKILA